MPTLNFIDGDTPEKVRKEIVDWLRDQQRRAEAEGKRQGVSSTDKKVAERLSAHFKFHVEYWESVLLHDPRKPPPQPVALAAGGTGGGASQPTKAA